MKPRVLCLGLAACLALAVGPRPRLLWNTTASVPIGLYGLSAPESVRVGDLVVVRPDPNLAAYLAEGGWLPRNAPLIKPVAAIGGQRVCRRGAVVAVDGRAIALALPVDGRGRALPAWSGCRTLEAGEVFLLAPAPGSLDGRYFGVTRSDQIRARARPLWIERSARAR